MVHVSNRAIERTIRLAWIGLIGLTGVSHAAEQESSPRVTTITWPATPPGAPIPDSRLRDADKVLFPVLIPPSFLNFKSFKLVVDQLDYSASVELKGASLLLTGTRIAADAPESRPDAAVPAPDAGKPSADAAAAEPPSATASMVRYGAAYMLRIDCEKVNDVRCANPRYAENMLAQVELMGGTDRPPTDKPKTPAIAQVAQAPLPGWGPTPPGELVDGSGQGVKTNVVYAPGMRFPLQNAPAYLNSQVWGIGGMHGKPGSWKDPRNYTYQWRDTFCEKRDRIAPACPSGRGHQGVDIRAMDPSDAKHWAVAVESGRIASIGKYSVVLIGESGARYVYLHLKKKKLAVATGARVAIGQPIGLVSNEFGGAPTSVHLHFEILQNVNGKGFQHVPPYASLIRAYERME